MTWVAQGKLPQNSSSKNDNKNDSHNNNNDSGNRNEKKTNNRNSNSITMITKEEIMNKNIDSNNMNIVKEDFTYE